MCGIGGNSLEAVKSNLTTLEIMQWSAYRERYGSLHIGRRIDQGFGNCMANYFTFKTGKECDPVDFMPYEEGQDTSFEQEEMQKMRRVN